jgi:peroxiredoxin
LKGAGTDVKDNFQVSATPVTIILDRSGKISLWWRGFQNPAIADKFRDKLDELFGK